ncbi:hypothetical protein [Mesorhizobium escarrei]|uniref:Uncharacterized protein n=1 Tax=Mesorhizobium escarrei TaxID=666018 RepID=A0ABM9E7Q0_9HYPH|nr:hypothetical protein [Mesorhizobium escarrei]CAH2405173.1 hypothetical protein MES5069_460002 [Mesorhizobium escarrei]
MGLNDYDARSNGNFDEVTIAAANDENGVLYIFDYRDGEVYRRGSSVQDAEPESCAGGSSSMRHRSSGRPSARHGQCFRWLVRVRDENGEVLCAIDVQEAQAKTPHRSSTAQPIVITLTDRDEPHRKNPCPSIVLGLADRR